MQPREKKIPCSQMTVGLKRLKVKSDFGVNEKDMAADVDTDTDMDMAAVFWDSSIGLYICSHCVVY